MDDAPLDPIYVAERLSKPPFASIDGVVNVRDLGSYITDQPGYVTKPGFLYRAGELSYITDDGELSSSMFCVSEVDPANLGRRQLKNLGIAAVYDLRSNTEMH